MRPPFWILAFAFFPLGLGAFALGAGDILQGYRSLHWIPIEGVILSSSLSPRFLIPSQPVVRTRYVYEGKTYVTNRLWPGEVIPVMPVATGAAAQRILDQFPEGKTVTVFVNPNDAGDVALIPGARRAGIWMGVLMFFVGMGLWSPLGARIVMKRTREKR